MKKVLYILGAGASAQALPTLKTIKEDTNGPYNGQVTLKLFGEAPIGLAQALRMKAYEIEKDPYNTVNPEIIIEISKDFNWLAEMSDKFNTVDTYAKFLFLDKKTNGLSAEYLRLKKVLTYFFLLEQIIDHKLDERVLVFLTTILEDNISFRKNIKILSWNYDYQIELAGEIIRPVDYSIPKQEYNKKPLITHYPFFGRSIRDEDINIMHLNGIAGLYYSSEKQSAFDKFHSDPIRNIENLLNSYKDRSGITDMLKFAWENDTDAHFAMGDMHEVLKEFVKSTEVIVVIGYSFPYFNRDIDNKIFASIKATGSLEKVYYQDPFRDGKSLITQFGLESVPVIHIPECDNYHVPYEL